MKKKRTKIIRTVIFDRLITTDVSGVLKSIDTVGGRSRGERHYFLELGPKGRRHCDDWRRWWHQLHVRLMTLIDYACNWGLTTMQLLLTTTTTRRHRHSTSNIIGFQSMEIAQLITYRVRFV